MQEALVKKKKKKQKTKNAKTQDASAQSKRILSIHLDTEFGEFTSVFSLFFFFLKRACGYYEFSMGPVHCSRDPQTFLFSKFFIKNESYGTIHTFKNYFATVFSIFIFQRYPNEPLSV